MLVHDIKSIENGRVIINDQSLPVSFITFQGIQIGIENPANSIRKGKDAHGEPYKAKMFHPYGFIKNTEGCDGDEIDCFVGPNNNSENVYIVHQKVDGKFDEDKVMLGFDSEIHARDAFLACYDDYSFLGPITTISMKEFKEKLKNHKPGDKLK